MPRQFNLNRLSLAGELRGLRVPPQRNLQFIPYSLGSATRRTADGATAGDGNVGADLKYSVTPSLTLDGTFRTDFAQVEVDDEQINLDRFTLFFPEKRPFFPGERGPVLGRTVRGGRRLLQPADRPGRTGRADPDHRRGTAVGEDRHRHQRRVPQHADGGGRRDRCRAGDGEPELHGGASPAGPAEPLQHRGHVRQSAGERPPGRQPRLQPHVRPRRPLGDRAGGHGVGFRGGHRDAGDAGQRRARVRPERTAPVGSGPAQPRLHGGGPELQPRGRLPGAAQLPADERQRLHHAPPRRLLGGARVPAPHQPLHDLRLRDRLAGDAVHAHRQPHRVAQRLRGPHRRERDAGGGLRAVPDLPGRLGAAGPLRPLGGAARRQHEPRRAAERQRQRHHRRPVRREPRDDHAFGRRPASARR